MWLITGMWLILFVIRVSRNTLVSERHLVADLKAGTSDEYENEYETDVEEDYD